MSDEIRGEVQDFAKDIIRGRRRGDLENLLATELALATNSVDPLLKIRHILEAYMLLSPEEKGKILHSQEESDRLNRVYFLTLALLNITPTHDSVQFDRSMIPFPFAPDKAHEYLDFLTISWDLSGYFKKFDQNFIEDRALGRATETQIQVYYKQLATYLSSGDASSGMCLTVKSLFVAHNLPWTLDFLRRIFTSFISAEIWSEVTTSVHTGDSGRTS